MTVKSRSITFGKKPTVVLTRTAIKKLQKTSPQTKTIVHSSKASRDLSGKKTTTHSK